MEFYVRADVPILINALERLSHRGALALRKWKPVRLLKDESTFCEAVLVTVGEETIMQRRIMLTLMFLLLPTIELAIAHDAWIEKIDSNLVVFYGHGAKHETYDLENVREAHGFDRKGQAVAVEIVKQGDRAVLVPKGAPSVVTMFYDGGYYVRTPDGGKKMTRREAEGKFQILESLRSQKCSKAFLAPTDSWGDNLNLRLEIVPEKDPFKIRPGEAFPLRVLLGGRPLEGAAIKLGNSGHPDPKSLPKSDKEGRASILIPESGFQLIVASFKAPLKDDPDAEILSLSSSLSFEVK